MNIKIDPERLYRETEVKLELGFTEHELKRARKKGQLVCKEVGRGRRVYLGQWLLNWLTGPEEGKGGPEQSAHG